MLLKINFALLKYIANNAANDLLSRLNQFVFIVNILEFI